MFWACGGRRVPVAFGKWFWDPSGRRVAWLGRESGTSFREGERERAMQIGEEGEKREGAGLGGKAGRMGGQRGGGHGFRPTVALSLVGCTSRPDLEMRKLRPRR